MEDRILESVRVAMNNAITQELVGYNKPLSKLTEKVISDHSSELYNLINDEFSKLLASDGFKVALQDALHQKLAKTLIARMGGELEKQVNELKKNPQTRAKITLAISQLIDEL